VNRRIPWGRPAAVAAALLLTACGQVHPGAAATVGDSRISFDEVDTLSVAYCKATLADAEARGEPVPAAEGMDSRRTVLQALLVLELSRQAADKLGVEVEPAAYAADEQSIQSLVDAVGEEYADEIDRLIEVFGEAGALQAEIGADQLDQEVSEADVAAQQEAGRRYVGDYAADVEIDIDPRLGLSSDVDALFATGTLPVASSTGSLSVPVSDEAVLPDDDAAAADAIAELPSTQVCA